MMSFSKGFLGFTTFSGVAIVIAICIFMVINGGNKSGDSDPDDSSGDVPSPTMWESPSPTITSIPTQEPTPTNIPTPTASPTVEPTVASTPTPVPRVELPFKDANTVELWKHGGYIPNSEKDNYGNEYISPIVLEGSIGDCNNAEHYVIITTGKGYNSVEFTLASALYEEEHKHVKVEDQTGNVYCEYDLDYLTPPIYVQLQDCKRQVVFHKKGHFIFQSCGKLFSIVCGILFSIPYSSVFL